MLKSIIRKTNLPVVAIGGIQIKDIKKLFNIGVSGIVVLSLLQEKNNLNSFIEFKKQAKNNEEFSNYWRHKWYWI